MSAVKDICKVACQKLAACAAVCEKYVKGEVSKQACVQPAKDVIATCKQVISAGREHLKDCKVAECKALCQASIKASEKAVEKSTACVDACNGMGSDDDCKIVCKDCAAACKACLQCCQDSVQKMCS